MKHIKLISLLLFLITSSFAVYATECSEDIEKLKTHSKENKEVSNVKPKPEENSENSHIKPNLEENAENSHIKSSPEENAENSHVKPNSEENAENSHVKPNSEENAEISNIKPSPEENAENSHVKPSSEENSENSHVKPNLEENAENSNVKPNLEENSNITNSEENAEFLDQKTILEVNLGIPLEDLNPIEIVLNQIKINLGENLNDFNPHEFIQILLKEAEKPEIQSHPALSQFMNKIKSYKDTESLSAESQLIKHKFYDYLYESYLYHIWGNYSLKEIIKTLKKLPNPKGFTEDSFTPIEQTYLKTLINKYNKSDETEKIMIGISLKMFIIDKDPYRDLLNILLNIKKGIHENPQHRMNSRITKLSNYINENKEKKDQTNLSTEKFLEELIEFSSSLMKIKKEKHKEQELLKKEEYNAMIDFIQENKEKLVHSINEDISSNFDFSDTFYRHKIIQIMEKITSPVAYLERLKNLKVFFNDQDNVSAEFKNDLNTLVDFLSNPPDEPSQNGTFDEQNQDHKFKASNLAQRVIINILIEENYLPFQVYNSNF